MKKILLDENLPKRLFYRLIEQGFDAKTVQEMGWLSFKNGKLLKLTIEHGFDIFLTSDKKIQFEQNSEKLAIAIVILDLKTLNYVQSIQPLLPKLLELIPRTEKNNFYIISNNT